MKKIDFTVLMCTCFNDNPNLLKLSIESIYKNTINPDFFILTIDGEIPKTNWEIIYELSEKYKIQINIIKKNLVLSAHDISSGGLIIALCEMSLNTNFGVKINNPKTLRNLTEYFFGEDQGRYILEVNGKNIGKVEKILKKSNIYYENIGATQKDYFEISGELKIDMKELYKINNKWYNNF